MNSILPEPSSYLPPFANQTRQNVINPVFQTPQPAVNAALLPKRHVEYVNGAEEASGVQLGPDSSALYLDRNMDVLWVVATDQNGNKNVVKGYRIGDEYVPPKPVTMEDLMAQMQSMNDRLMAMEEEKRNG